MNNSWSWAGVFWTTADYGRHQRPPNNKLGLILIIILIVLAIMYAWG